MKKKKIDYNKIIFLFLIIFIFNHNLLFADDYTFRKTKWGMSMEEVRDSESIKPIGESNNFLAYKSELLNKKVNIVYSFVDNKLVEAMYSLDERHMNTNDYIRDYYDFKKILKKKYGESKITERLWKNDLYRNDESPDFGLLISMGHLVFHSIWKTPLTDIILVLHGDNLDIKCSIAYYSKKLMKLKEKKEEKKALESF